MLLSFDAARMHFSFDTCVPRLLAPFVLVQQSFFLVSLGRPHCIGFICRFQAGLGMWLPGESEDNILVVFQHFCIIATDKESCSGHDESIEISQGSVLIHLPQLDSILPCVFFGSEPQIFFWLPLMYLCSQSRMCVINYNT